MKIEFTYTFDDFRQAQRMNWSARRVMPLPSDVRRRRHFMLLGVGVGTMLVVIAIGIAELLWRWKVGNTRLPILSSLVIELVPVAVSMILTWAIFWGLLGSRLSTDFDRKVFDRTLSAIFAVFILSRFIAVAITLNLPRSRLRIPAESFAITAIRLFPWIFLVACILVVILGLTKALMVRLWNSETNLHLVNTLELTLDGIKVSNANTTIEFRWPAFRQFCESPQLFVIYYSQVAHLMVPKRAFSSPEEMDVFRSSIEAHVPCADARRFGFPVGIAHAPRADKVSEPDKVDVV